MKDENVLINKINQDKKGLVKELPENFFERVIELELNIKKDFTKRTLEELIFLYSTAIEYYESIENPRFKDYQSKLNSLLAQPNIIKKISEPQKNEKKIMLSSNRLIEIENKKQKEQVKKDMKLKIDYKSRLKNISNNETEIRSLIQKNNIGHHKILIENDLENQEINFKNRLKEKKRISLMRKETYNSNSNTQEMIEIKENDQNEGENEGQDSSSDEGENRDSIKNSANLTVEKSESKNESLSIKNSNISIPQNKSFLDIQFSIDSFIKDFGKFYTQNVFFKYNESFKAIIDEKFEKFNLINSSYETQIKEIEDLLNDTNQDDDQIKGPFLKVIEGLQEEQENQLNQLNEEYDRKIQENYLNFNKSDHRSQGIKLIEEKLKLELFNNIENMLNINK